MLKLIAISSMLIGIIFSARANSNECNISGVWNHSAKPATLFINVISGEISVHSHELNPESIGLVVLKNLTLGSSQSYWDAKMYSAAEDSFVDVRITSTSCTQLSVSFNNEQVLKLIR